MGAGRPQTKWQTSQFHREDVGTLVKSQGLYPGIDMAWVDVQPVNLEWQDCHFGGFRPWFLCPVCGRRCRVLYLMHDLPKCFRCGKLSYPSQSLDKFDRSWQRTRKLEARIGAVDFMRQVPFKPKRMHWDTFEGTIEQLQREQAFRNAIFVGWGKRYFGNEQ